jgi:hypothetical protein
MHRGYHRSPLRLLLWVNGGKAQNEQARWKGLAVMSKSAQFDKFTP